MGCLVTALLLGGCGDSHGEKSGVNEGTEAGQSTKGESVTLPESSQNETDQEDNIENMNSEESTEMTKTTEALFDGMEYAESYKSLIDSNPIMTQRFGADPYAMVYGDTVYFYMTADAFEYDAKGEVLENTYSKIRSINVVSTKDMINFTDHGSIPVAGKDGIAKWANNSWAPAAAWKNIDGKDRFFLYFADAGGGIGVLEGESPVGPFVDPLGKGLIRRDMENCGNVLWLFDPAVLVDDDGRAYIYFGGGVPEGCAADPGTGRVAELGDDMISLKGVPVRTEAPYLFEDSGIHKYNDKYYYTFCSNFSVDAAGTEKYGFTTGEIICMVSDSPMGPFTFQERILKNPGAYFGVGGNNHHCVFCFQDHWYITYHARSLEQKLGVIKGYRSTHIDEFTYNADGIIGEIKQTLRGREQLHNVDPYVETNATTVSVLGGLTTTPLAADEAGAYGVMVLDEIKDGAFVKVSSVDFGSEGAKKLSVKVKGVKSANNAIQARIEFLKGKTIATVSLAEISEDGYGTVTVDLDESVTGVHDLYFVFAGSDYQVLSWEFTK